MFGGVFRFVVELHLGVQACAIAGWALFSCESIGPSPKHEFTDRKPDTPQPFLSSAPDEIQTAERSAWTHMVQKNSHTVRFMSFFFTCQRQAQPLRLSNMCCSYSVCLPACLFFASWDSVVTSRQWTFSQLPFSALMYWFWHFQLSINFAFVWEELKRVNKRNFSKLHSQTALIFSAALSLLFPMFLFATNLSTNWVIF